MIPVLEILDRGEGLDTGFCLECGEEHSSSVGPDCCGIECARCGCHVVASVTVIVAEWFSFLEGDHSRKWCA